MVFMYFASLQNVLQLITAKRFCMYLIERLFTSRKSHVKALKQ